MLLVNLLQENLGEKDYFLVRKKNLALSGLRILNSELLNILIPVKSAGD